MVQTCSVSYVRRPALGLAAGHVARPFPQEPEHDCWRAQVNTAENNESMYTAMAVTVDVREGTTTGISASDRARTLRALAAPDAQPQGFRRPGHIVPLRYQEVRYSLSI